MTQLGHALAARGPLLLILEQVGHLAQGTVGRWLGMTREARFIATSRELLRVPGEVQFDVAPLSVPDSVGGDGNDIARCESVQLFVERIRAGRGWAYEPSSADLVHIAQIVRQLDGIPLAIELAAARLNVLGLPQIVQRLTKALDVLGSGARASRSRQSTLRDTIRWSWDLLSTPEREALCHCAMFRGGFTLDAAEQVISIDGDSKPNILDLIQSLREKSLLRYYPTSPDSEEIRFGMYETIREFVEEQLAHSGNGPEAAARHARYYLAVGEQWSSQVRGREGIKALASLRIELENLLAAFERACPGNGGDQVGANTALRLALCVDPVLSTQGPSERHRIILERALGTDASPSVDASLKAQVLRAQGRLHHARGHLAQAAQDFEAAAALATEAGDVALRCRLLVDHSIVLREQGRATQSRQALEEAM